MAISPSNSKIEFIGAKVTASQLGGFTDFAGEVDIGDPIETSKIEVSIQTASVYTDQEKLTLHLKTIKAGKEVVTANAEFSIDRQDYGISYAGMRDDLIRDPVVIKLSLKLPRSD